MIFSILLLSSIHSNMLVNFENVFGPVRKCLYSNVAHTFTSIFPFFIATWMGKVSHVFFEELSLHLVNKYSSCFYYGKLKLGLVINTNHNLSNFSFLSTIMISNSFFNLFHDNIKDRKIMHHSDSICPSHVFVVILCKFKV